MQTRPPRRDHPDETIQTATTQTETPTLLDARRKPSSEVLKARQNVAPGETRGSQTTGKPSKRATSKFKNEIAATKMVSNSEG